MLCAVVVRRLLIRHINIAMKSIRKISKEKIHIVRSVVQRWGEMMERLTKWSERTTHKNGICCTHFNSKECREVFGNCSANCEWEEKAWSKLAYYENLEEQGLLLRLPCKVGDTVWCVEEDDYCGSLFMAMCGDYVITCSRYVHLEDEFEEQLEEMSYESADDFGVKVFMHHKKDVFLTREEAEAKLKETESE
jgi:hypothetical protein